MRNIQANPDTNDPYAVIQYVASGNSFKGTFDLHQIIFQNMHDYIKVSIIDKQLKLIDCETVNVVFDEYEKPRTFEGVRLSHRMVPSAYIERAATMCKEIDVEQTYNRLLRAIGELQNRYNYAG